MFKRLPLLAFAIICWVQLAAAQSNISGTVKDGAGMTLPGVSILEKNTTNGTLSDADGKYSISIASGATLVFSYVGMVPSEVIPGTNSIMDVTLEYDSKSLNEVVVTGYQSERKKDITGAVSVVNIKDIKDSQVGNPAKALQGRVPGVLITTDGAPGGGATVRIRGGSTLGNNDPLYIIDGIPTKRGLNEINPADVESIQVLKDASSATIYGSRAANGVVIVTTKKAKNGQARLNVNISTSIQDYATKLKTLDANGRGRAYWQAAVNDKADPNANQIYQYDWNNDFNSPALSQIKYPEYIDAAKTMKPANTYWYDEISQKSIIQSYDMSISNGSEKGNTMFSLGYYDNKGIVKSTHNKKYTARLNTDFSLFKSRLKIGENLSATYIQDVQSPTADILFASLVSQPVVPVYTVNGGWGGPASGMTDRQNPVRLIEDNRQNKGNFYRLFGNVFADLEIIPKLHLKTSYGIDYSGGFKRLLRKSYTSGFLSDPTNQVSNFQDYSGNSIWQNTLNYDIQTGKHQIGIVVGQESIRYISQEFSASRRGLALENINYAYLNAGSNNINNGGSGSANSLFSYFAKVNYTYADKFLASATVRRDGSSRFGKDNRFGTFPAFSLGYRLSEETFIKDMPFISDLKLRYGWGRSGNQEIPNNATQSLYSAIYGSDPTWDFDNGSAYDIGGNGTGQLPSGFTLIQQGNDALRWESLAESNFGVDFGFLNNSLTGSVDYFQRKTSDILISPAYLAVIGDGGNRFTNGASMKNSGVEALLSYDTRIGNDLRINLTGNFSLYRNKITYLPKEVIASYPGNGTDKTILGRPANSFFGYVADGIFQNQSEVDNAATQPGKGVGRIRYADLNNDGLIDAQDRDFIGNSTPKYMYGFNTSVTWKNFDLNFFFQGINVKVQNEFKTYTDFSSLWTGTNWGERTLDAWTPQNTSSDIPALTLVDRNNEGRFSTYFIENGSYLKLRNAQIGYNFKSLNNLKIQSARLYLQGSNLFTIKSKSFTGPDPEIPNFAFPVPVIGTIGLNVTF
jgi:TonB-linked SusC/RagA family outer membrane protein